MECKRMWINQASALQPLHRLHGTRVLALVGAKQDKTVRIYFLDGSVISQQVPKQCLAIGDW